jgi:hypothetical protein
MRVQLGNTTPHEAVTRDDGSRSFKPAPTTGPAVTYLGIPDSYTFAEGADHRDLALHLARNPDITRLPDHEAFLAVAHPNGVWANHSAGASKPSWVWSDDEAFQDLLSNYYETPAGIPGNVEDTHHTLAGGPGVIPMGNVQMLHTSWGRDMQALVMGGFMAGTWLGATGTATASSATSLTGGTETGAYSHAVNDAAGQAVVIMTPSGDAGKWAFIKSNTTGTSPVYTVDRWYAPGTPGAAAPAAPSATSTYSISPGGVPAIFVALTNDTTTPALAGAAGTADAPAATTALTGEPTTAGAGLLRKIAPIAHTAGTATWTATPVFTANGTDTLPFTAAKSALCASLAPGGGGLTYMTLISPTATLSASGDNLTLTWTFTMT